MPVGHIKSTGLLFFITYKDLKIKINPFFCLQKKIAYSFLEKKYSLIIKNILYLRSM